MAVVEAAFVTPIFFILIFGILEVGLAMNDYLALSSTVRAGSRAASASGNDPKSDLYVILGMSRESAAINRNQIKDIVIYRSDTFGEDLPAACFNSDEDEAVSVTGQCNVYSQAHFELAEIQVAEETAARAEDRPVDPSKITFGCGVGAPDRFWCPTDRKVTLSAPGPEYVGVWMRIDHPAVTGAGSMTFTDSSVIRLEPRSE